MSRTDYDVVVVGGGINGVGVAQAAAAAAEQKAAQLQQQLQSLSQPAVPPPAITTRFIGLL